MVEYIRASFKNALQRLCIALKIGYQDFHPCGWNPAVDGLDSLGKKSSTAVC
jgi:hypothetical protein